MTDEQQTLRFDEPTVRKVSTAIGDALEEVRRDPVDAVAILRYRASVWRANGPGVGQLVAGALDFVRGEIEEAQRGEA